MPPPPANKPSPPALRRPGASFLARVALLIGVPALFFCALEGALRIAGFGKPTAFFIPDGKPGFYRTNPNFTAPFIPASFGIQPLNFRIARHKDPGGVRVFVVGESAAQGMPDPDFGFAAQLRVQLGARFPERKIEVCDLGITAINSNVVYRLVRQVSDFEPDLIVIYMGNNEVIGPYGPGCAYLSSTPGLWFIRTGAWIRSTRTGQAMAALLGRVASFGERPSDWKGMETFSSNSVRAGDPRLDAVYRNFSANLRDMISCARRGGTRVVLATVVANLKDNAPFISLHREGISGDDLKSWTAAFDAGKIASDLGDTRSALFEFEQALRLDPEYAETYFRLGSLYEAAGDGARARERFEDALHWDALHFRPDPRINEEIRRVAGEAGVPLVDLATAMGADPASSSPLAGREMLFDHVHFNWEGNYQAALLLAEGCGSELDGAAKRPREAAGASIDACASELGFTPDARLKMLQTMVQLTLRPPFTGQYTFSRDQADYKYAVGKIERQRSSPDERAAELRLVEGALQRNPANPSLALRAASLESEAGNLARAQALMAQSEALQPPSADLTRRKAQVLLQMRRYDEAESLLLGSVGLDRDYFVAGGALADLWASTRQFEKGRQFFSGELGKRPANHYLRLEFAQFLARSGDTAGAEHEAQRIWADDPRSRPAMAALELRVRLKADQHRQPEVDALTLEAAPFQPGDYFNNQRLLGLYTARNDAVGVVDSLRALESSGPFGSEQHLDLAHRLSDLNRVPEMLDELATARDVALIEHDGERSGMIDAMIATYRGRFADGNVP
jgi:tetratricopeptide (TPR) repeat protein